MKQTTTPGERWMRLAAWIAVAGLPGLHLAGCGGATMDDTDEADAEVGDVDDGIEVRDDADVPHEDGDGAPCLCTDDSDCDDDEPCNGAESCFECACVPGEPLAAGAPCEDGDQCTEGETCGEGVCGGGSPSCPCEDDDDCLEHDDGDLCNGRHVCSGGFCAFDEGTVVTCDTSGDTNCLVNRCVPATGECEMTPQPDGTACEDGSRCSEGERCSEGSCAGGTPVCECSTPADCEAHDDDDLCNGSLRCGSGGFCEIDPATVVRCDPSGDTACSVNRCVPATGDCVMTPRPDGTSCDDVNACTLGDACSSGACVPMAMRECRDTNPCTDDSCAPATGCVFANNTASCDDGNACTVEDRCAGGTCAGTPRDCDDGNVCTDDSCNPLTGCVRSNNTLPCNDGLYCNGNDTCSAGSCSVHAGSPCPGHNVGPNCNDSCNEDRDNCTANDLSGTGCDDGLFCTATDACNAGGSCIGSGNPCPGHNVGPNCNDSCNEDRDNCTANDLSGTTCDDGNACTAAPDVCSAGTCVGGPCTSACRWWPDEDTDTYGDGAAPFLCLAVSPGVRYANRPGDCCDTDARVNPAQTSFFATWYGCGMLPVIWWDYNCDRVYERRWTTLGMCVVSGTDCRTVEGWWMTGPGGVPACGETGSWLAGCRWSGGPDPVCEPAAVSSRTQECR